MGVNQVTMEVESLRYAMTRVVVVGGAGFIGAHFVDTLMAMDDVQRVRVFDNFSSGRRWHVEAHLTSDRFDVVQDDDRNLGALTSAFEGFDTIVHLASNPDIAAAVSNPLIDFDQGTLLTQNVVEAMRRSGCELILYASGSGVYGDLGERVGTEDYGPLIPESTYGASKLAGEALIASYCHMFGLRGRAFRFANVVGPRQTHGVGYDFVGKLLANPSCLDVLGDGHQSKSYIHVDDVIAAVLTAANAPVDPFATFNVATLDYISVKEIAELAIELVVGANHDTSIQFAGGERGWQGDVPIVRLNSDRIRRLGWHNNLTTREALQSSLESLLLDFRSGKIK
ncbi:MAG TPA: NAD-dependent epimerase/dehydratase family protein [Acidimicrobiales bacterium]|nr:NAD-dependent epimerase/dehydratase family protein [Acidimicrobiales bacterium]